MQIEGTIGKGGATALLVLAAVGCGGREAEPKSSGTVSAPACTLRGQGELTPLSRVSSQVALGRGYGRTLAFIADEDSNRLYVVDIDSKQELTSLHLSTPPGGVVLGEGGKLAVTLPRTGQVRVLSFDGKQLTGACTVEAPAEPVALTITPDRTALLVVSAWGHALTSYGTAELKPRFRVDLPRDPRAVVVDSDGKRAFVSHGVGSLLSVVELDSQQVRRVKLDTPLAPDVEQRKQMARNSFAGVLKTATPEQKEMYERALAQQLNQLSRPERVTNYGFSLALSVEPEGRVLVPHVEVDPGPPDQRTGGYGDGNQAAATPAVAVIDAESLEPQTQTVEPPVNWVNAPLLAGREACRLPRAAALDGPSGRLFVACVGSDTLIGYDAAAPNPIDAEVERLRVAGGPTGLAIDEPGRRVVVWSQFERALSIVPIAKVGVPLTDEDIKPLRIDLPAEPGGLSAQLATGRRLFHAVDDSRIAGDGRACANCHIGGRDDGLVWSTPTGPRRTKTLAGLVSHSAPYSWDGSAKDLHAQVEGTFQRLGGQGGLRGAELDALVAYVSSLPEPPRTETGEARLLARGASIFASTEAACATCHTGVRGTDTARHPVQSETQADVTPRFDTPGLGFLEGRAPYFHDGRYATLRELLVGSSGKMGHTAQLSPDDLTALETYLESL